MATDSKKQGKYSIIALIIFFGVAILSECQSAPPKISIESPQAIMSPAIYGEAMVTMTIKNDGGSDVLKGVSADSPGANVSLHVMEGRRMARVEKMDIPGGSSTVLKMGGSHVMIENMPRTVGEGAVFTLTMSFEKSGEKKLSLKLEKAPAAPMNGQM
jgi:copper(I)-binding protein